MRLITRLRLPIRLATDHHLSQCQTFPVYVKHEAKYQRWAFATVGQDQWEARHGWTPVFAGRRTTDGSFQTLAEEAIFVNTINSDDENDKWHERSCTKGIIKCLSKRLWSVHQTHSTNGVVSKSHCTIKIIINKSCNLI